MSTKAFRLALLAAALGAPLPLTAQSGSAIGASSPEALAEVVMQKFADGTPDEFAAIFPDSSGRVFMRSRSPKKSELMRVAWRDGGAAVLLLAGTTIRGSGGDQTNAARHFSGFYEAAEIEGEWRIVRKLPLDTANYIRAQALSVDVTPGVGIEVVDTLTLSVGAPHGIAFRINNGVEFKSVHLNGKPAEYAFGGGIVWVDAPQTRTSELVLEYTLAETVTGDSTGAPAYGAYHNTDVWHPAFGYIQANHLSPLTATVRIPAEYHLTTTIPQTDTVTAGVRTVRGESLHHEFLLALIFDRDWEPQVTDFGSFRFESFTTPEFRHSHDTLAARTRQVYELLAPRFGEPQSPSRYLAAVENRALGSSGGFRVRMNNASISGTGGGALGSERGQIYGHETGHAWTMNATGLASNFLREGWAKFVESLLLREMHGPEAESFFWEVQRNSYMTGTDRSGYGGGFEGNQSILGNFDNGRIHYTKGSWILKSATHVLGDAAFERGMRHFIGGMGRGRSGYEELIAAWSEASGLDMSTFVMPWLTSRYVPNLSARVDEGRLIVTQEQPGELFDLPGLEIELITANGRDVRTMHLRQQADTLLIGDIGAVTGIRVDPDHHFLIQRKWGENVRFTLPVAALPGATTVQLVSNFLRQGGTLEAVRDGDAWVVDVPLTEGQYVWIWTADGERASASAASDPILSGTRVVQPLHRVENAYPGR